MKVQTHHWGRDRSGRKMRLNEFIKNNPGIDERKLMKVMSKLLKLSHRAIRGYLSELEVEDEIENRDGKFYPFGYEDKQHE